LEIERRLGADAYAGIDSDHERAFERELNFLSITSSYHIDSSDLANYMKMVFHHFKDAYVQQKKHIDL
jgi:hypothetical protein